MALLESRLQKRIRDVGVDGVSGYIRYLERNGSQGEYQKLINCVTTNLTYFFREEHHFRYLEDGIKNFGRSATNTELRIWCAACSTGEEAYSIAMGAVEARPELLKFGLKILASDIDDDVLDVAKSATYTLQSTSSVDSKYKKYFDTEVGGKVSIASSLRKIVDFKNINLNSGWVHQHEFDFIFCRNAMIYFDDVSREVLFRKFRSSLKIGGVLMLGHSERMDNYQKFGYDLFGNTAYIKV